jgi:proline dehydrogenase
VNWYNPQTDMVSFDSTEIAFKIKSNRELNKAYFLFKAISSTTLVKAGGALSNIAISIRFPIKWIVKPTIYSHFCGGETIEDCLPTVTRLSKYNVKSILDYSVEGKENPDEIEAALNETLLTIENAARNEYIPFAVFKPTAFGSETVLTKKSAGEELSA